MIGTLLNGILGNTTEKEEGQGKSTGSLLVVGIIVFVLLGGLKLFQKQDDAEAAE